MSLVYGCLGESLDYLGSGLGVVVAVVHVESRYRLDVGLAPQIRPHHALLEERQPLQVR